MFRLQPRSLKADFSLTLKSSPSSPPAREAPAAFPRLFSGRASEPCRTVLAGRSVEERKKLRLLEGRAARAGVSRWVGGGWPGGVRAGGGRMLGNTRDGPRCAELVRPGGPS